MIKGKLKSESFGSWEIQEGEFKDFLLDGQGKRTDINKQVETGTFAKGKFIKGEKTLISDGLAKGEFKDGKLHGQGQLTWLKTKPKAVVEEGLFYNEKLVRGFKCDHLGNVSEGVFATSSGSGWLWKGDGLVEGKITYRDGTIEEGEFTDNKLNGKGKRTKPNGSFEEGIFNNGILAL